MNLRLVKDGEVEADPEAVEMIARATERMVEAAKGDGAFWLVTAVGDDVAVAFWGGKLEAAVLAETVAADMKREAVGL